MRVRRALTVESELNDGIATPIVTRFLAFAVATEAQRPGGGWLPATLAEIGLAVPCRRRHGRWLALPPGRTSQMDGERRRFPTPLSSRFLNIH